MSQQELEQGDLEVMGTVNGHSHPDAAAAAEEIAAAWEPVQDSNGSTCEADTEVQYRERCREGEKLYRKHKRIEMLKAVLCVVAYVCIAAALVAVLYVPKLQIWVVNVGVLACGIAAAVKIDKYIRWWR